jgi:hypothetical protein
MTALDTPVDELPPGVEFYAAPVGGSRPVSEETDLIDVVKTAKPKEAIKTSIGKVAIENGESKARGGGGGEAVKRKVSKAASGSAMAAVKAIGRGRRGSR